MENKNDNPKAVVGVMTFKNGKVLIGKRHGRHGEGEYSFTGGHIEYMQSFEGCARQETLEEAGIKIKNIKFLCLANSDYYSPRHEILVGLIADWDEGEPQTFEDERIGDWAWYDLDNLPSPLFKFTKLIIDSYKSGKNYYDKE